DTEPPLRTAWLMACDQVEREMAGIIAKRLGLPADDLQVRLHAAAASAAVRVLSEHIGAAALCGDIPEDFEGDVIRRVARAVRDATGGAVGDVVGDVVAPDAAEIPQPQSTRIEVTS
ncbi:acyl-CoA-like ligand-binding transcription factor, partial [Streptomyces sp. NPDC055239]